MSTLQIIVLGIIQGLTEFLPISSTGHLVIANEVFEHFGGDLQRNVVDVNIVLHLGTLAAILIVYFRRVARLVGEDRRVLGLLFVGSLPAAAVGFVLKLKFEDLLGSALLTGFTLPLTGILLLWAARRPPGELAYERLGYKGAFFVGLFQALALLPGISRSGATIAAGLAVGLRRQSAATFSFLLAIPAILGAGVLEMLELSGESTTDLRPLLLGGVVSMLVGLAALAWLLRWLERGRIQWFAYWCIPLGLGVLCWQFLGG